MEIGCPDEPAAPASNRTQVTRREAHRSKSGAVDASRQPLTAPGSDHLLASRTSVVPKRNWVSKGALTSLTALSTALSMHPLVAILWIGSVPVDNPQTSCAAARMRL